MALQEVHPLIIRSRSGDILDVSFMNEKAYTKSIERKELWHLHRSTGRVLPFDEKTALLRLCGQQRWYEAVVERDKEREAAAAHDLNSGGFDDGEIDFDSPAALRRGADICAPRPLEAVETGSEPDAHYGELFTRLEDTIRRRKMLMPEGSYTTYLFTSGEEKIRKKTGEEAVELLLAREEPRIVSEAADLIYHLLVLLVFYDIPFAAVCGELAAREEEGREK
jgi:phosphoribosyl-AMP cyclohydrolase / phosphoribosyl-ATP pyrophosphohydrolase